MGNSQPKKRLTAYDYAKISDECAEKEKKFYEEKFIECLNTCVKAQSEKGKKVYTLNITDNTTEKKCEPDPYFSIFQRGYKQRIKPDFNELEAKEYWDRIPKRQILESLHYIITTKNMNEKSRTFTISWDIKKRHRIHKSHYESDYF